MDAFASKREQVQSMFRDKEIFLSTSPSMSESKEQVKMLELLGMGSTSRVYKAKWQGVIVAQKVMHLPYLRMESGSKMEAMLAMEAAISASLCHPNVVQTYSCEVLPIMNKAKGSEGDDPPRSRGPSSCGSKPEESLTSADTPVDEPEVVMWEARIIQEYCSLGSLEKNLRSGQLPGQSEKNSEPSQDVALRMARDIAAGMMHIHAMQVVHGDLKVGNVLLQGSTSGIVAKVADFGLSIKLDNQQTHMSNITSGTVTHMSPELLQHNKSSAASDVYAYGILLYELFTGLRAWKNKAPGAIMTEVVGTGKRPVFPPYVTPKVVELACSCWAQEADRRPTFKDVLVSVDQLISLGDSNQLSRSFSRSFSCNSESFTHALPSVMKPSSSLPSTQQNESHPSRTPLGLNTCSFVGTASEAEAPHVEASSSSDVSITRRTSASSRRRYASETDAGVCDHSSQICDLQGDVLVHLSHSHNTISPTTSRDVPVRPVHCAPTTTNDLPDGSDIRALQLGCMPAAATAAASQSPPPLPIIRPVATLPDDIHTLQVGITALRLSAQEKPARRTPTGSEQRPRRATADTDGSLPSLFMRRMAPSDDNDGSDIRALQMGRTQPQAPWPNHVGGLPPRAPRRATSHGYEAAATPDDGSDIRALQMGMAAPPHSPLSGRQLPPRGRHASPPNERGRW